jgi:hypothetical protein
MPADIRSDKLTVDNKIMLHRDMHTTCMDLD